MQIPSQQLERQCQKGLHSVYLLQGDEPLLFEEAASLIIDKAKAQGFVDRSIFHCDLNAHWEQVLDEAAMLSLFDDNKILDIRFAKKTPDAAAKKALEQLLASPRDDQILLIRAPLLGRNNQKQAWFKTLDKIGCIVTIWPIKPQQLLPWVKQRMQGMGLRTSNEGYQFLTDCVEGNLLAADQEIKKLRLLFDPGMVSLEQLQQALSQLARYDIFQLCDTALAGKTAKIVPMLESLRDEKTEATLVLWALSQDLRTLAQLQWACAHGSSYPRACQALNVWEKRKPLFKRALEGAKPQAFYRLLDQARKIDGVIKGLYPGNSWRQLQRLTLAIANPQQDFIDA